MAKTTTTTVQTADGPMDLYEALPEGKSRGAVIVVQEAFGVNEHIQDVTRRFAAAGYRAVAPALFHRAGGGTAPYTDFSKVMPLFKGVNDDAVMMDVDATLAHLRAQGFADAQIGLVGFCFGGRVSFLVATRRKLGAVVGFYGGGIVAARRPGFPTLIGDTAKLGSPWLGLFGDKDQGIPVEDVEVLRATLARETRQPHEVVLYEGAEHGFHCDVRPSYQERAAKDAWRRTLEWLEKHVSR
ncbi:MAG TPA: dienelactone hydrolase family protein [Myxococcota bacterium]|nr:dienelactone hydrolase family protein [Myxococcota bacterium]